MASARAADSFALRFPGLSSAEAGERARASGVNRVRTESTRSYWRILVDHAFPAANVALVSVSVVLMALGLFVDALMTAGLVIGNIAVGVFQETRAKRQLERIAVLARADATVIRDGREQPMDPDEIVQGDIVVVGPGDQVQADGVVLAEERCSVDESLLTGESDLVRKVAGDDVYSGSFCMSGRAVYRCERVGAEGFANRIAARAREFHVVRTPLQREVGYVMWAMALVVALISIQVIQSFHNIYGRVPLVETTRAAAVIVALIPQGLWVMVTVTYAMAIVRMSPLGTLVQRLNAVESMSHVDVLCLDKTGTITTNTLKLEAIHALDSDEDELRRGLGRYCASVSIGNRSTEAILAALGGEALPVAAEVHFDSARKWSALAFDCDDVRGVFVLGAPEVLAPDGKVDLVRSWTDRGLRVLLFAWQPELTFLKYEGEEPQLPPALVALGYVIMRDELRPGARETIARFAEAGIALKIISGDHPATVAALAREAGVQGADHAVSGLDIARGDRPLAEVAAAATVFGRVAPDQKAQIVEALQERGHYVAMIGDGVNDVPAMKQSEVAIAVRAGSPVTRGIADIILLDDSFSALPSAFSEGRRIRAGMSMIVRLFLVRTISVALMISGVALLASEFPLTPRHTAILSALTVGIPALFIAAWARPATTDRYLIPSSSAFVVPAAVLLGVMGVAVYQLELSRSDDVDSARTVLTSAAVVAGALIIPFVDDDPSDWMTPRGLLAPARTALLAALMLACFVLAIGVDPLRRFYELDTPALEAWLIAAAGVAGWAVVLAAIWRLPRWGIIAILGRGAGRA
jgi:cation-transporting ATPase E